MGAGGGAPPQGRELRGRERERRRLTSRRNRRSWWHAHPGKRRARSLPVWAGAAATITPTASSWSRRVRCAAASAAACPAGRITTWRSWRSPGAAAPASGAAPGGGRWPPGPPASSRFSRARFTRMRAAWPRRGSPASDQGQPPLQVASLVLEPAERSTTRRRRSVASGGGTDPSARRSDAPTGRNFGAIRSRCSDTPAGVA